MSEKQSYPEMRPRIREILMGQWDPIGVRDTPEAADEYDLYLWDVYRLIVGSSPASKIFEYLRWVEVERMGLVNERGIPLLPDDIREAAALSLYGLRA